MNRRGMTLVELLAVGAIVSVFFALLLQSLISLNSSFLFVSTTSQSRNEAGEAAATIASAIRSAVMCDPRNQCQKLAYAAVHQADNRSVSVYTSAKGEVTRFYEQGDAVWIDPEAGEPSIIAPNSKLDLTYYAADAYNASAIVAVQPNQLQLQQLVAVQVTVTSGVGPAREVCSTTVRLRNSPRKSASN